MDSKSYEQLSAFIDGDLVSGAEPFARRLARDGELSAGWLRYHLIGDCLRGEGGLVDAGFTRSLLQRIAEEPTVLAPPVRSNRAERDSRWARWATGAAIAASVAAVAVVTVTELQTQTGGFVQQPETAPAPPAVASRAAEEQARWNAQEPEVASKLNRYLANHSDFASRGSLNGMTPLATFVSYDE